MAAGLQHELVGDLEGFLALCGDRGVELLALVADGVEAVFLSAQRVQIAAAEIGILANRLQIAADALAASVSGVV